MDGIRVDYATLNMSQEDILKQILPTGAGKHHQIDVRSVIGAAENILSRAIKIADSVATGTQTNMEKLKDMSLNQDFRAPSGILEDISREIGCKVLHGDEAKNVTISLLNMLSGYSWATKAVLILAAFAVNYGELWLLTQYTADQLANSVATLKKLNIFLHPSVSMKLVLFSLNNLVKAVLDAVKSVVEIEKLSKMQSDTSEDLAPGEAMARIPVYVYWSVMTLVYCASQISSLARLGEEYQPPEIFSFSHILNNINCDLKKQLQ